MSLRGFPRRLLAAVALLVAPSLAAAQGIITLRADSARRIIAPSRKLAVPVLIDMSAAARQNLASIQTGVTFGTSRCAGHRDLHGDRQLMARSRGLAP